MNKIILLFYILVTLLSFNSRLHSQAGWISQQSNTTVKLNKVFFINTQTGWVVGDSGKILKTIDGGNIWIHQNSSTNHTLRSIYFLNESLGYAIGGNYYPLTICFKQILKTTNGGTTWVLVFNSPDFYKSFSDICFIDPNTGFGTGFGGNESKTLGIITKTTDGGISWFETQTDYANQTIQFKGGIFGWIISNFFLDVGGDSLFIHKTSNSGSNWHKIYSSPKGRLDASIFINNNTGWVAGMTHITGFNRDLILRTTDGGMNWENSNLKTRSNINSIHFSGYDTGWYCGSGIFYSVNSGANWINQIPSNGIDYYTSITFIDNETGWVVGTNGKILSTITGGINSVSTLNEITPGNFYLNQNYPNPFNPTTDLEFGISKWGFVSLEVFDIIGKKVATLVNENLNPGTYKYNFNASGLTSGIYFYKLTAGDYTDIKKMTLLK